jgi:hypothetical protein
MLTDEELTTRLGAVLRDSVPELTYAGTVPKVRRRGGLAATSVLTAATALALVPAGLNRLDDPPQAGTDAGPDARHSPRTGHTVVRTVDVGGMHLTYAEVDGKPGPLYLVIGPDLSLPADAKEADLDTPGEARVWFVDAPAPGEPQVYVRTPASPMLYGLYGDGWTHEQLSHLLEHPMAAQRGED